MIFVLLLVSCIDENSIEAAKHIKMGMPKKEVDSLLRNARFLKMNTTYDPRFSETDTIIRVSYDLGDLSHTYEIWYDRRDSTVIRYGWY